MQLLAEPPPHSYSPHLESGLPDRWRCARTGWCLLGLFLLALVPRLLMIPRLETICDDAYYYLQVAAAYEQKNFAEALEYLDLNVYPLILRQLHAWGWDWVLGAQLWGALAASLVVLPMFGWVRRMFDDRVALVACFMYACHPEVIELSVEPVRDPTFWLFLSSCLHFTWRAVAEPKWWLFACGGTAMALAASTRSEGWLLVLPFAFWMFRRVRLPSTPRWRLSTGGLTWLAATPLLVWGLNVTALADHTEWRFGRLSHFAIVWSWLGTPKSAEAATEPRSTLTTKGPLDQIPATDGAEQSPQDEPLETIAETPDKVKASDAGPTWNPVEIYRRSKFFKELVKSYEPISLVMTLVGLCWLRLGTSSWDKCGVLLFVGVLYAAVVLLYVKNGMTNSRYFLTMYVVCVPYAAISAVILYRGVDRFWHWLRPGLVPAGATIAWAILSTVAVGWGDSLSTRHHARARNAEFAAWLRDTHGPFEAVIAGPASKCVGHLAKGSLPTMIHEFVYVDHQLKDRTADLVVFSKEVTPKRVEQQIDEFAAAQGLVRIDVPVEKHERYFVWARCCSRAPGLQVAAHRISSEAFRRSTLNSQPSTTRQRRACLDASTFISVGAN